MGIKRNLKDALSRGLAALLRVVASLREGGERLYAHALLRASVQEAVPASVIVLGKTSVYGSGRVSFGENVLLYPDVHLETQEHGRIEIGDDVVISRGTHIVAMDWVSIGRGTMIGEYSSIRDANHSRDSDGVLREAGHSAKSIEIGCEVWIGRGVAVLGGVEIGDYATVGANAVVTRDVPAETTVAGIPAAPIISRAASARR
jgi:acetyltransferase-like isoleucine patch superfamily enzyme